MDNLEKNKKFFGMWARIYDLSIYPLNFMRKPVLKEINYGKILDVSCGTGLLLAKLKGELFGIDLSSEMLEVAKKRLGNNVKLKVMDVHALEFDDGEFDFVLSTLAFHHYNDQEKALKEMVRVCKGKVIIMDIDFFKLANRIFAVFEPGCVKVNTKIEMKSLFEKVELKNIVQKRIPFGLVTIGER
jgi:ubiquinone/menaquinone biosynthesis C-methylase UbiE